MTWHSLLPAAVFLATFIASVMSGMAGGGGSIILTPFYIFIGLTPQQAVATNKFGSFGVNAGSIAAFRGRFLENKRLSVLVITIATAAGLAASLLLRRIDNSALQLVMGVLLLLTIPLLFFEGRDVKKQRASTFKKTIGTAVLVGTLFMQGLVSVGIGALVSVIFIVFFGMTTLAANAMKRKSAIVLNTVVVTGLLNSGLINYKYGLFGMAGGLLGGYAGSHIAIKKGDEFAKYALLIFMLVSGIWLITSA